MPQRDALLLAEMIDQYDDVPWGQSQRLCRRIVHGCWSVDTDVLVMAAERGLPGMVTRLREVLTEASGIEDQEPWR